MRKLNIPALIMLIAGLITSIFNIINKVDVMSAFKRLIIVLITFYIIGLIANGIIKKTIKETIKENETNNNNKTEDE